MKTWINSLTLALVAALAGCADTPENEVQIGEVTSSMVKNPDEVTCRSVVRTGTRIGSKKCMTNQRWAEEARNARESAETVQRKSNQVDMPQGG